MRKIILAVTVTMAAPAWSTPLACLIEPDKVAEIGAPVVGIIDKVSVERGDFVKAGQVLASFNADVERASAGVASTRAQADADLKAAQAAQELAQSKLARARNLVKVGFISKEAVDQSEAEAKIAQNRVLQAEQAQRVAGRELQLSNAQLAQRTIRSPFAGVVLDRYHTAGERIEREPIVRIAKVDPLRVELVLPVAQFGHVEQGSLVNIRTDLTGGRDLPAKVVLIDKVVDAASNTFRVRLALPNPDHGIPAGLRCTAELDAGSVLPRPSTPVAAASDDAQPRVMKASYAGRLSYRLEKPPVTR
jgi:RND family efflux transporter MFP subunit